MDFTECRPSVGCAKDVVFELLLHGGLDIFVFAKCVILENSGFKSRIPNDNVVYLLWNDSIDIAWMIEGSDLETR